MITDARGMGRRDFLCVGGGGAFAALVATLTAGGKLAQAQAVSGAVPEVDRLMVRVVTDSYHQAISPSVTVNGVQIQRYGFTVSDKPPRKSLVSEFGLSLHVESQKGTETRQILVDFGFTPETLNNNLELLRIDPAQLDALVLSHGHYDHFGGLVGFLQTNKGRLRKDLPFYLGGEECFCARELILGGQINNFGYLDRKAIQESGLKMVMAEMPAVVASHAFTTGHIGKATFERVLSPTRMTVGIENGIGCFPDKLPEQRRKAKVIPDEFDHEQATCFHVNGKGLVVMTSCGHRGVVNSVKRAIAVSGMKKVHAVLGGFHLAPHKDDYVRDTVMALKALDPDVVMPMHCTGEPFHEIMAREMPNKLVRSYTGSRYVFGA